MGNKVSPIIIVVLILLIVAIVIFAVNLLSSPSENKQSGTNSVEEELVKPMLDLSLDTPEENQEKVVISAYASVEDGSGIVSITLPDGTEIQSDNATYEVTENGNYTFKATSGNNAKATVSINVSNIKEISATNPYIPEKFTHVEGTTVEDGFTIEDEYGNQYVWIPVESGKLTRNRMLNSDYEETNSTASALVNSAAKYYGFYIAKYEASEFELNGEKVAASMEGKIPWTNITYLDAAEYCNNSAIKFEYEGYNTSILNSYAWDTILEWIDLSVTNYSSNTNYGNYSGTIYPTGTTETDKVKNICDLAGNVREWTTEINKPSVSSTSSSSNKDNLNVLYRVVRGGSAVLSRTPAAFIGYPENTSDTYWGFRMILYK